MSGPPNETLCAGQLSSISSAAPEQSGCVLAKASWESGYPSDCKSAYSGSIPDEASILLKQIAQTAGSGLSAHDAAFLMCGAGGLHYCDHFATVRKKVGRPCRKCSIPVLTGHIFAQLFPTLVWHAPTSRCIHVLRGCECSRGSSVAPACCECCDVSCRGRLRWRRDQLGPA